MFVKFSLAFKILQKFPEITKYLTFLPPKKLEEIEKYFKSINNLEVKKNFVWGIWLEHEFVGQIGLHELVYRNSAGKQIHNSAEIGYWLSPEYQGKGLGKLLIKTIME